MATPFQATARLTKIDSMSSWQQALVAAGIFLGLGGGLLASQLFEWSRSGNDDRDVLPDPPTPTSPPNESSDLGTPAPPPPSDVRRPSQFLPGVTIGVIAALLVTKFRIKRSK